MTRRSVYIDAYNVLRKHPRLSRLLRSNAEAARLALVQAVTRTHGRGVDLFIVFDGHGVPIAAGSRVHVVFTRAGSADGWIRGQLERSRHPRQTLVISSDHEVAQHARAMGAAVQPSEQFLDSMNRGVATSEGMDQNRGLTDGEVREWLALFEASPDNSSSSGGPL